MSFVQRKLKVIVQLTPQSGTNQPFKFDETGTNTVTLEGNRVSAKIQDSGAPVGSKAQVKVFGMKPSLMNQLSTLGLVYNIVPLNVLTIQASSDDGSGYTNVFIGTIFHAYADYSGQPNVPFIFDCMPGAAQAVIPAAPTSFTGSTDVATIMSGFARHMGMGFENNGVNVKLSNPYYTGGIRVQAQQCAEEAGIEWGDINGKLAIWPKGGSRTTPNMPIISRRTGMIGYPGFTQQGVYIRTLFNPQISFGQRVKIETDLFSGISKAQPQANFPTEWAINKVDLDLESQVPKGHWEMMIWAYNPGYSKAILPPVT